MFWGRFAPRGKGNKMIRNNQQSVDALAEYVEDEMSILCRLNATNIRMNESIPIADCFDPICLFESRMLIYEMQKRIASKDEENELLKRLVLQELQSCSINEIDLWVEELRMQGLSMTVGSLSEKIKSNSLRPEEYTIIAKCILNKNAGGTNG